MYTLCFLRHLKGVTRSQTLPSAVATCSAFARRHRSQSSAHGPFTAKRVRLSAKRQRPARRSLLPNARLTTSASQHWRWRVPQSDRRRSGLLVVGAAQVAQMPIVPAATTGVSERCTFPNDMVPASWLLCAWLGRRLRLIMMTHS